MNQNNPYPLSNPPLMQAPVKSIPAIPPNVAAAIVQVMGGVPRLAKDETNVHGNYAFTSIDDFLEAVRPLCAGAGLIILQDEVSTEMTDGVDRNGKPKRWLTVTHGFTLAHASGETWEHRPLRSVVVDASMGAQAFGAAQSYNLKLFMRSLFQISTGEKGQDVDAHPPNPLPSKEDKKAAFIASCRKIIASHTTIEGLRDWWNSDAEKALRRLHDLTQPEVQELVAAVNRRKEGIEAERSAPSGKPKGPPRPRADVPPAPTEDEYEDPEQWAQQIIANLDSMNVEAEAGAYMRDSGIWDALEDGHFTRQSAQAIETAFRAAVERANADEEPPAPE